jgi:putative peptide zinc metalloprotease protein
MVTQASPFATEQVTGSATVRLHPLAMRRDGEEWIVGRVETGEFVAVPDAARQAIALLGQGLTADDAQSRLLADTGDDLDLVDFVVALAELGFLASVNGAELPQPPLPRVSLSWITPRRARWALHPATGAAVIALIMTAVVIVAFRPGLVLGYRNIIWTAQSSAVLLGFFVVGWLTTGVHELGHLVTARAAGAPARISLGTRLQFLALQTDVTGVAAAPRRTRLTVYLAGIAVNLSLASLCVLVLACVHLPGTAHRMIAFVALANVLPLGFEFLLFMRTDVYFVLQDLAGTRSLYADGSAYLRYLLAHGKRVSRRRSRRQPGADPSAALRARERRVVRAYCLVLAIGTAACLAIGAIVTVPVALTLYLRTLRALLTKSSPGQLANAITMLALMAVSLGLWVFAWWRRHGSRVRRWLSGGPGEPATTAEGGET